MRPAYRPGLRLTRLSLALVLCSISLLAQTPQAPVFRTKVDVVPLTVTVVDKAGHPVTDLTASDFAVIENKQPREILTFFAQTFTPQPMVAASVGPVNRAAPKTTIAPETRRTFLIVLGYGRIQYPTKAVDGAIAFIRERLLPQDLVAVMAFDRATDFTTDHEQVARMLERFRQEHERIVFEIDEWLKRGYTRDGRLPPFIRDDIDAVFRGVPTPRIKTLTSWDSSGKGDGAMRDAVWLLQNMDRATRPNPLWNAEPTLRDFEDQAYWAGSPLDVLLILQSPLKGYAGIEYLRYVEGERHMLYLGAAGLVMLAPGHPETDKTDDAQFARRLNDARITLHMVRTTGPNLSPGGPHSMDDLVRILGYQHVAEQNGGTYTSVAYADKALAAVDQASRFSYLLGYAPVSPEQDGNYRNVEVRVARRDLTVRYQHGYYASDQPPPVSLADLVTASRLTSAFAGNSKDIAVGATADMMPRLGVVSTLRVEVKIDASRLMFNTLADGTEARIELHVYVGDAKDVLVGESAETLHIPAANDDAKARFVAEGIRHVVKIPLSGVAKRVKIVAYDYGSDLLGSITLTMK